MGTIITELNLHDSWHTALRVISTSLTGNVAPLIFGPVATTPETVGLPYYLKIKQKVEDENNESSKPTPSEIRLTQMEELWPNIFTMKLLEFFQARLLGPFNNKETYCSKSRKYCNVFLDIVGEAKRDNTFRIITGNFFVMMKEYIRHRMPGKRLGEDIGFAEVLKECRNRYKNTDTTHKYYVDFEESTYASGILDLLDELATDNAWTTSPHCEYLILASEYLNALAIYLYMIEFCIYSDNLRNQVNKTTFFAALEKHIFDFGDNNRKKDRVKSLTVDKEEALPTGTDVYLKDESTGKCYTIPALGDWTIGRQHATHPEIDIQIETEDKCMSRNHARLTLKRNPFWKYVLTICDDLDRLNETYVWRTRLNNRYHMQLFEGDKMLLGETIFTVHIKY